MRARLLLSTPIIPNSVKGNLLAFYDGGKQMMFNPPVDNTWYDFSGNGRNMTMYNLAYTPLSTISINGFECDGADDYGEITDSAATRLITGGTLTAWIYPKTTGESGGRIFHKGLNATATNGYLFTIGGSTSLVGIINAGTLLEAKSNAITLNRWQFAAMTFDSTGRHIYVNCIDVTTAGGTQTTLPPDVAGSVAIGNRVGATDRTFDGYIDRAAIFNRALTQPEIKALYQGSRRKYGV